MAAAKTISYPPSESGYWKPEMTGVYTDPASFRYIPGRVQAVNEDVLKAMIAAGVVKSATPTAAG